MRAYEIRAELEAAAGHAENAARLMAREAADAGRVAPVGPMEQHLPRQHHGRRRRGLDERALPEIAIAGQLRERAAAIRAGTDAAEAELKSQAEARTGAA